MNDLDKNSKRSKTQNMVSQRVINAVDEMLRLRISGGKNLKQFADQVDLDYSNAAKYRRGEKNIGSHVIYNLVNEFDLNPDYIFREHGPETESLVVERSVHIAGNVGNNNTIINEHNSNKPTINVHGTVGNLNVVHTLEKLISDMPPEMQEKLLTHFNNMNREMESLKKTADRYEKQLVDKNEQLDERKRELVETKNLLKKKDAQLSQKDAELHQAKDELIRVQKNVNELQSMYVETVKKTEEIILSQTGKRPKT